MKQNDTEPLSIVPFNESDLDEILTLFRETVRTINAAHYSSEQIAAWAPDVLDRNRWLNTLKNNITYVASINNQIVGFGDATHDGTINHLYTHKDFQGMGIGTALLNTLEQSLLKLAIQEAHTEASITAKPFFERRGYHVTKQQDMIHRTGVVFRNYVMTKKL